MATVLGDPEPRRAASLEKRKELEAKRENLIRAIASGIISNSDVGGATAKDPEWAGRALRLTFLRLEATAA